MCSVGNSAQATAKRNLRNVQNEVLYGKWKYAQGAIKLAIARIACDSSPDCEEAFEIWRKCQKISLEDPDYTEFKEAVSSCLPKEKYQRIVALCGFIDEE